MIDIHIITVSILLDICSAQLKSFVEFRPKLRYLFSGYWFFIVDSKIVLSFVNPSVLSTYIASLTNAET